MITIVLVALRSRAFLIGCTLVGVIAAITMISSQHPATIPGLRFENGAPLPLATTVDLAIASVLGSVCQPGLWHFERPGGRWTARSASVATAALLPYLCSLASSSGADANVVMMSAGLGFVAAPAVEAPVATAIALSSTLVAVAAVPLHLLGPASAVCAGLACTTQALTLGRRG